MKIFEHPFSIANEVVKRTITDNRRLKTTPVNGGNNLFYLGMPEQFFDKFNVSTRQHLQVVQDLCKNRFEDKKLKVRTLQKGEGIRIKHFISKKQLITLIPFIDDYLKEFGYLYHNANFRQHEILSKLEKFEEEFLVFYSDLVFIYDKKYAKPYFKWFNYKETFNTFKLIQEFFIPYLSFLNFEYRLSEQAEITIEWALTYKEIIDYSFDNIETIVSESVDKLPLNASQKETIKDAIIKIRIGQTRFRSDLLKSDRNLCILTGIKEPSLLIAGHIKPWKLSDNSERRDTQNGILLSPTYDKLFDKFLITFDESGNLIWSQNRLNMEARMIIQKGNEKTEFARFEINDKNRNYIEFHRNEFMKLETTNNL